MHRYLIPTCAALLLPLLGLSAGPAQATVCPKGTDWHSYAYEGQPNQFRQAGSSTLEIETANTGSLHYQACDAPLRSTLSWRWRSEGAWNAAGKPVDVTKKEEGDRRVALWVGLERVAGKPSAMEMARNLFGVGKLEHVDSAPDFVIIYTWADRFDEQAVLQYENGDDSMAILVVDNRSKASDEFRQFERDLFCDYLAVTQLGAQKLLSKEECEKVKATGKVEHRVSAIGVSADSEFTQSRVRSEVVELRLVTQEGQ